MVGGSTVGTCPEETTLYNIERQCDGKSTLSHVYLCSGPPPPFKYLNTIQIC